MQRINYWLANRSEITQKRADYETLNEDVMGYTDDGVYVFDATASGNSNSGHDYGSKLSTAESAT
jgi:hypothetical protein